MLFMVVACAAAVDPLPAQQQLTMAWHIPQHTVWVLDWAAAPIGGPLTVETWRSDGRVRLEILEAVPPALRGQTLVFDGQTAWRYNRFAADAVEIDSEPMLSPVSDALARIEQALATPADSAQRMVVTLMHHGETEKIVLNWPTQSLTMWLSLETRLPVQLWLDDGYSVLKLSARSAARLRYDARLFSGSRE